MDSSLVELPSYLKTTTPSLFIKLIFFLNNLGKSLAALQPYRIPVCTDYDTHNYQLSHLGYTYHKKVPNIYPPHVFKIIIHFINHFYKLYMSTEPKPCSIQYFPLKNEDTVYAIPLISIWSLAVSSLLIVLYLKLLLIIAVHGSQQKIILQDY